MIPLWTAVPRVLAVAGLAYSAAEALELRRLRGFVRPFRDSANPAAALSEELHSRVRWYAEDRERRRPVLRATASSTLRSGRGFCGENARVAVLCLLLLGRPANRMYLWGSLWGHVAVEYRERGRWWLFDSHADPATHLPSHLTGSVASDDLASFPNGVADLNPWVRVNRIRHLRALEHVRTPPPVTFVVESPYLVKALLAFALAGLCSAAKAVTSRPRT